MPQKTFVISWDEYPYSVFKDLTGQDIENALGVYFRNTKFQVTEIHEKDSIKDSGFSASDYNNAD